MAGCTRIASGGGSRAAELKRTKPRANARGFVFIVLRRKLPDVPRPYRVPGGIAGAWIVAGVTTFLVAFTVIDLIWPGFGVGWFGTSGSAADSLPSSFAGQRKAYTLTQVIPLLFFLVIGVVFYLLGRPTRRLQALDPVPTYRV